MSNVFEREGPLRPGDVVLLFAGPTPTKYLLGTWLQSIAQDARRAAKNVPIFVIGLDPATMGANSVARALEEMTKAVGDQFPAPKLIELETEEAEACLAACPFQEANAIVVILDAERLRFVDMEATGPKIESVEGSVIRISEKDDLSLPHVAQLCAQICHRAPAAGQKWLVVSRGYGFGAKTPAMLAELPNLDIHQVQEEGHDGSLAGEFRELLATVQADGPDKALSWVAKRLPTGKIATIARANILSLCGQPGQAYRAMAEISTEILSDGFPEEIIQLAQMALSAGIAADSSKWIGNLPPPETLELENLRAARLLAKKLRDDSLWQKCVAEFRRRFPNDPLTRLDRFNELVHAKDYEGAAQQADATGHPYRREIALFLADPTEPPLALLKAAESAGELPEAYWIAAESARDRKEYAASRDYLHRLSGDEKRGGASIAMRVEILRAQIPEIAEAEMQEELRSLMTWCANHPAELDARFAIEKLYESVSTEREALVHTAPVDGPAPVLAIAHEALALLEQCEPDDELAPLLSVAAQAAQFSEDHGGGPIPPDVRGKLESYLDRVPESSRGSIRAILGDKVTVDLLRMLATRTIRASADWSASLSPALVAARRALFQACESGDASLFWTACLILCQPGLSVRVSERSDQSPHADPVTASKWLAKQIRAGTENPLEAIQVQRAMSHASSDAVGEKLFEIPLTEFLELIDPRETVVLLATDNANRLYRLELRRRSAGAPTRVGSDEWDIKRFNVWSRVYPAKYGLDLEIYFGAVCKPPAADVAPTLAGLLPSGRLASPVATLVVEGRLLTFTHRLASDLAGSATSVAVCPSARWLGVTRRRAEPKPQTPVAWLGSPRSSDRVVQTLQSELTPVMRSLNIDVSTEESLPDCRSAHFVILGSHGRADNADGFSRLSDNEQDYEPDRVAAALAGTTCVVLFVCHAGRGDEAMFSHETNGLTSSLLRHGVRTVVAALWPVEVTIVAAWLEEFGKTDANVPVVERVDQAQRAMAKRAAFAEITGENPLVRCTFTVFGDGCLSIRFPERQVSPETEDAPTEEC